MQEFAELEEEDGDDPWWRTAYPTLGTKLGIGFEYREIQTGHSWFMNSADLSRADKVWLDRTIPQHPFYESRAVYTDSLHQSFDFVACHHDAGCCRIHETHSRIHRGCFLPIRPKPELPLTVGDEYFIGATGELFIVTELHNDGRLTLCEWRAPMDYAATRVVTVTELEQNYEYSQGYVHCSCNAAAAACPIHVVEAASEPEQEQEQEQIACDHEARCCPEHRSHVRPHRECVVALL